MDKVILWGKIWVKPLALVYCLNGVYQFDEQFKLSLGIDNVFDKEYAEHISKSGLGNDALPIEERTKQVNEPGRTLWAKLDYEF
ncbi:TonB-dependent receptor (plasmid) [Vibrio alfacsensis]|uniref:TonB-dependent receptor n=1 Tax=Vibrio alfacsensis TaxID=1074311 RepID=A0ABN5PNW9_9VIBR|nr:TonB-dependent receptor [Vibrio alfacsensis]